MCKFFFRFFSVIILFFPALSSKRYLFFVWVKSRSELRHINIRKAKRTDHVFELDLSSLQKLVKAARFHPSVLGNVLKDPPFGFIYVPSFYENYRDFWDYSPFLLKLSKDLHALVAANDVFLFIWSPPNVYWKRESGRKYFVP